MFLSAQDWAAIGLTVQLAIIVTLILLVMSLPLAWWLARTSSHLKVPVIALIAMPLILPPTVLGFYLLLLMGPEGFLGQLFNFFNLPSLLFSFSGLVVASVIYSLPFAVQPIYAAMQQIPRTYLEAAATMGASPRNAFFTVVLPLCRSGIGGAAVLTFMHTIGEFGVVLMIGGNIPNQTQVLSIHIYDQVEALNYDAAHGLAAGLVVFSFAILVLIYGLPHYGRQKNEPVK